MPLPINELNSEAIAVLAKLTPASVAAGTATIGPFNAGLLGRVMFLLQIGAIAGGATVDAKVQAAPTSGGTYVDVPGAAIAQVTVSAGKVEQIEVKGETLAALGLGPFVRLQITVANAAVILSGLAVSGHVSYSPASDLNTPIDQTVIA